MTSTDRQPDGLSGSLHPRREDEHHQASCAWPFYPAKGQPTGLMFGFLGQLAALVGAGVVAFSLATPDQELSAAATIASLIPMWIAFTAATLFAARSRRETLVNLTSLRAKPLDVLFLLAGVALQFAVGLLYLPFEVDDLSKPAEELRDKFDGGISFVVFAIAVGLGAPVFEELFYRGLITRGFARLGVVIGHPAVVPVVASAFWFALIHGQPLQFPALFLVGAVCALLLLRTGRLIPAVLLHVGFNLTTVVALANA